jgi:hypothetical protein
MAQWALMAAAIFSGSSMPGRHVTDQQMRLSMTLSQTHPVPVAAKQPPARASPELRGAPLSPRYQRKLHHVMGHC